VKREIYDNYIYEITTLLKNGELFPRYDKGILAGKNDFKLKQVFTQKNYKTDWIDTLEDCITALDTIVRNPRKFIVIEEDIVDVSLARSISVESVKHLAQHTNLISSVKDDGTIIPSKILNTSKEESFEIYENRFVYTLLLKARDFLTKRFDIIKAALLEGGDIGVEIKSDFSVDGHKFDFNLDTTAKIPFDAIIQAKAKEGLTNVERLTRISQIFNDFLSSAFAKEMRTCALVRPPITRTNVILKDPNFKKALILWQFIESSENMDFSVSTVQEETTLPDELSEKYRCLVFLNSVMLQSIAAVREDGVKVEEKKKKKEDIVPDDFPFLRMDLNEVRRVYYKNPDVKSLSATELKKLTMAIERCIRQYKINEEKIDSERRRKLILQQQKEAEEAKKLALREAEEERKRLQKEAEEAAKEERRLERERILAEKQAELERLEEEKRLERERIEAEERMRVAREEEIKREAEAEAQRLIAEEEKKFLAALEEKRKEERARLALEEEKRLEELREEQEKLWKRQKVRAVEILVEQGRTKLTEKQLADIEALKHVEKARVKQMDEFITLFKKILRAETDEEIRRLTHEAHAFHAKDDMLVLKLEERIPNDGKRKPKDKNKGITKN